MRYTSDLIEKIITSPSAKRGLDYITPIYRNAYTALWLMQAIGLQTDLIIKWIDEYKKQAIPQTATWALPYYEEEYGIPVNTYLTIEERRKAVLLAIMARAPMNPAKLSDILSMAVNADIKIKENVGKNSFCAEGTEFIDSTKIRKMKTVLEKYKPAHLIYWFNAYMKFEFFNKYNVLLKKLVLSAFFQNFAINALEEKTRTISLCHLKIGLHFKEEEKIKSGVTLDTMWYLNGEYRLNGKRKLNAAVIKVYYDD